MQENEQEQQKEENEKQRQHVYHIILLDDNMFYRSMRHEYFQLARKCNLN